MLTNTARELVGMGYEIEPAVDMANDIDELARKWGVGTVEDMKEALIRSIINNPRKDA